MAETRRFLMVASRRAAIALRTKIPTSPLNLRAQNVGRSCTPMARSSTIRFPLERRPFSSAAETEEAFTAYTSNFPSKLRNLVKPFLLKCHPDVLDSEQSKQINLRAIQNLNAFMDAVQSRLKPPSSTAPPSTMKLVYEIDFCVTLQEQIKGKVHDIPCRRKIELSLPAPSQSSSSSSSKLKEEQHLFRQHSTRQVIKLMQLANIDIPASAKLLLLDDPEAASLDQALESAWEDLMQMDDKEGRAEQAERVRFLKQQKYETSRAAFVRQVDWKKLDQAYRDAMKDAHADMLTEGLIRNHPGRRMAFLAGLLSRIRILEGEEEEVDAITQLVTVRRLSLLLDEQFDHLEMEDMGRMWERCCFVLTAPRAYNTSPTALRKRRQRLRKQQKQKPMDDDTNVEHDMDAAILNDGFAFTLHGDNSVTIQIPVDFRDEELVEQLKRNVSDFWAMTDTSMDGIYPTAV